MIDHTTRGAEPPLVTFALFAYNQEAYIREAVEAALTQSYSPLEIILSDDCSTDGTFAIMEELVAAYSGPHRVRAVRTPQNLGLIQHVLLRGREAAGAIVVLAAGDDVSLPHRVAVLAKAFTPETGAAYSLCDQIDEHGALIAQGIERGVRPKSFDARIARAMSLADKRVEVRVTQGSTAAYRSELFHVPVNGDRKPYSEEMLLCFFCYVLGLSVELVSESLVAYRQRPGALSNFTEAERVAKARRPESEARFTRRANIDMYFDFHEISCKHDPQGRTDRAAMVRNLREEETKFFWTDSGLRQKLGFIAAALLEGNWSLAGWCIARMTGLYDTIRHKVR